MEPNKIQSKYKWEKLIKHKTKYSFIKAVKEQLVSKALGETARQRCTWIAGDAVALLYDHAESHVMFNAF